MLLTSIFAVFFVLNFNWKSIEYCAKWIIRTKWKYCGRVELMFVSTLVLSAQAFGFVSLCKGNGLLILSRQKTWRQNAQNKNESENRAERTRIHQMKYYINENAAQAQAYSRAIGGLIHSVHSFMVHYIGTQQTGISFWVHIAPSSFHGIVVALGFYSQCEIFDSLSLLCSTP